MQAAKPFSQTLAHPSSPMKTIVTLVSVANHGPGPFPIYGASGRAYGHARFDPKKNRQVFELPYEEYLKIGPHIAANATNSFNQWFAEFRVEDGGEDPVTLRAQLDEVTGQRDSLQTRLDDLTAKQLEAAPSRADLNNSGTDNAPARALDGAVTVLRIARDLPAVAEDKIVTLPDGTLEKQHSEIHPVQVGSPTEDHAADGQTGKTTTREQVAPGVEVITEHEKVEAPEGQPTLADSIRANLGSATIENQDATEASTAIAAEEGKAATGGESADVLPPADPAVDAEEKGGESPDELARIASAPNAVRNLRDIARAEGVEDFEKLIKPEDIVAAIQLHREAKAAPPAGE